MELVESKASIMPMHTIPPEQREEVVKMIMGYLITLIGVDIGKNPPKLAMVEKMIEDNARRKTPLEIKEAFDMYVKGSLQGLEPISGLLDSITFNKVINQYNAQKVTKPKEYKHEISDDEKAHNEYLNIVYAYDEWKQDGYVKLDYHWTYDTLKEKGLVKFDSDTLKQLNVYLRETYPNFSREKKQKKGKALLLEKFFESLKCHIKELI